MTDQIGYDALTQAAMRGIVRDVLKTTQENGAPAGDHHFYITFLTKAPGVKIADHLVERFPNDMTIVVQHQYWDLEISDSHFEIILKFSGVPQHLHIPFAARTRFVDPSVNFALTLEPVTGQNKTIVAPAKDEHPAPAEVADNPAPEDASKSTVVNIDAFRRNKQP